MNYIEMSTVFISKGVNGSVLRLYILQNIGGASIGFRTLNSGGV